MNSRQENPNQIMLFDDIEELGKQNILERIAHTRTPEQALTELEMRIVNHVKAKVQDLCESNPDEARSGIILHMDPMEISTERDVKNIYEYKKRIFTTISKLQDKNLFPGETIILDDTGEKISYSIFTKVVTNPDTKSVTIKVSGDYIDYVMNHVLPNPEVRMLKDFIKDLSTKYSSNFIYFLNDSIGKIRKKIGPQREYEITINKNSIKTFVPTDAKYTESGYMNRVIMPAIEDINNSDKAPYRITNENDIVIYKGRSIASYRFIVEMKADVISQPMFLDLNKDNRELIDQYLVPCSWSYLFFMLDHLHVDKSFKLFIQKDNDRMRTWKTYLHVASLTPEKRNGRYFHDAYASYWTQPLSVAELTNTYANACPQLIDEVITAAMEEINKSLK